MMELYPRRIPTNLGDTPIPELPSTRADVFVSECSYCLEVQLRPTQFRKRTAQGVEKGETVCWFIRGGLDTENVRKAFFRLPAVRFRVIDGSDSGRPITPWDDPDNNELNE